MVRSLVVALVLVATLVATPGPHAATPSIATSPGARPAGDGPDEPIDCSIPDNQDDTGCDTGDVQDSVSAIGDSGDTKAPAPVSGDNVAPLGGVQTGLGGMAAVVAVRISGTRPPAQPASGPAT